MEVIADVQPLCHPCQFFIILNMSTVDLSAADLFVTAVTRDWKSLATSCFFIVSNMYTADLSTTDLS